MAVSINDALDIIYKNISPVSTEVIPIELALGRILAKDCIASFDMPRFDNSTRDGYAVKCADAGQTVLVQMSSMPETNLKWSYNKEKPYAL